MDKLLKSAMERVRKRKREDPQYLKDRDEVISKYGKIFHPDNLDKLTKENFLNFFYLKHNKHWTNNRPAGRWAKNGNIEDVKKGLKILLDENKPLAARIKQIAEAIPKNKNFLMCLCSP